MSAKKATNFLDFLVQIGVYPTKDSKEVDDDLWENVKRYVEKNK